MIELLSADLGLLPDIALLICYLGLVWFLTLEHLLPAAAATVHFIIYGAFGKRFEISTVHAISLSIVIWILIQVVVAQCGNIHSHLTHL